MSATHHIIVECHICFFCQFFMVIVLFWVIVCALYHNLAVCQSMINVVKCQSVLCVNMAIFHTNRCVCIVSLRFFASVSRVTILLRAYLHNVVRSAGAGLLSHKGSSILCTQWCAWPWLPLNLHGLIWLLMMVWSKGGNINIAALVTIVLCNTLVARGSRQLIGPAVGVFVTLEPSRCA